MHAKLSLRLLAATVLCVVQGIGAVPALCQAGSEEEVAQTVIMTNIEFKPTRVTAAVGDKIRFINQDKFEHDIYVVRTANRNIVLISRTTIAAGKSIVITLEEGGLFTLYCTIHGGMSALISTTGSFELSEEDKKKFASMKVLPPIVKTGEELFWDRAQCHRCHQMGDRGDGLRGPNLQDIGFRAVQTADKLGLGAATAYIMQSLMEPSAHIVEGYSDDMPKVYQPPVDLGEEDLKAIVTYLQSQGGEVDTWAVSFDAQKLATGPALNPFTAGDPVRGHAVFQDMRCFSCHQVGDQKAISIGPDLTAIGAFRNWAWLAQSLIDPNAEVGANWQSATVYLKLDEDEWEEEDEISGILRKNTTEEVILLVASDRLVTIAGDRVDRVEVDTQSRMAANFGELVTFQQMADLVRYLQSLKGPTNPASPETKEPKPVSLNNSK